MDKRLIKNPTIADMARLLAMEARRDKSGEYSFFDQCPDVSASLSHREFERYMCLHKDQREEMRRDAFDVTLRFIDKMVEG